MEFGFLSQFARRPSVDGTTERARRGAGQVDDLHNLFGAKGGGRTRTGRISEGGGDSSREFGGLSLSRCELGLGLSPAVAPFLYGERRASQLGSKWLNPRAVGQTEHDAQP